MPKTRKIVILALLLIAGITAFGLTDLRPADAQPSDPCDWASCGDGDSD